MGAAESHAERQAAAPAAQYKCGMVQKESETLKAWNPRYAILEKRVLSYWDTEALAREGAAPRGRISLENCRVSVTTASDVEHPDSFVIETPAEQKRLAAQRSQTRMYFQAATLEEVAEWVAVLRVASREPWADDASASACIICARAFDSLMNRRHHCRRCGRVVCEVCANHKQVMVDFAYADAVRVCSECRGQTGPLPPEADRQRAAAAAAAEQERKRVQEREAEVHRRSTARHDDADARRAKLREKFIK